MFPITRRAERARREWAPLARLHEEMDALFGHFLEGWRVPEDEFFRALPAWNWEEGDKEMVLRSPVAGFAPNEVDVRLMGNELTVRAEHREEATKDAPEARYGRLERTITLPEGVDPAKLEAHWRNGLLEVHVPRLPAMEPRRIEVKT